MGVENKENLGVAFALVIGAGLATAAGAAVVFVPRWVKLAGRKTLAGALGLSAGVMTYVSFVEIFQKSVDAFEDAGKDADTAQIFATLCFFGGVILMIALNSLVSLLLGGHHHHHSHDHNDIQGPHASDPNNSSSPGTTSEDTPGSVLDKQNTRSTLQSGSNGPNSEAKDDTVPVPACPCCTKDPVGDLERVQQMADEIIMEEVPHSPNCPHCTNRDEEASDAGSTTSHQNQKLNEQEASKLLRMSINTAVAIGLHNFPEGLATFVAALDDPRVGAVLAIAIAIHNIPEGLCVAMPIYYATGQRWKAFGWALFSGMSEPLAALLGWAVLASSFSDGLYAVLFGIVAGMMVIISVRELLPTAHRYDPEDCVVTYCFMTGMGIMALSLVLFRL